MSFPYDAAGIEVKARGGDGTPLPDARYALKIIKASEGLSKNGDYMVTVDYEVMDGPHQGKAVRYHNVTFFADKTSKGASMSLHFLKSIGQPYAGEFIVEPSAWIGAMIHGTTITKKKQSGKSFPEIRFVDKYTHDFTRPAPTMLAVETDEEIPF